MLCLRNVCPSKFKKTSFLLSLRTSIVLPFIFRLTFHIELISAYGVKQGLKLNNFWPYGHSTIYWKKSHLPHPLHCSARYFCYKPSVPICLGPIWLFKVENRSIYQSWHLFHRIQKKSQISLQFCLGCPPPIHLMVLFYHLAFCSFHTSHKVSFHSLNESTSLSSVLSGFCANVFSQKANLAPSLPKLHSTWLLCFISDNPGALQNILFTSYSLLLSPECNLR